MKRYSIWMEGLMVFLAVAISSAVHAQTLAYYGGTVKNSDNQAIENVLVAADGATSVLTDVNGTFQLAFTSLPTFEDSVPGGDTMYAPVLVNFTREGYEPNYRYVLLEPGDSVVNQLITMYPPAMPRMASGHVADENSQPIANAHIVFYLMNNPAGSYMTFDGYTDASGNFSIQVDEGQYYVEAIAYWGTGITMKHKIKWYDDVENFADASLLTVSSDVTGIDFNFTTPVACTISGTVTDQTTGQPVAGAFMAVYSTTLYDSSYHVTDANGHYTINLYDGEYTVSCFANSYLPQYYDHVENFWDATPVVVSAANPDAVGIDFDLLPAGGGTNSISGTVTDESSGLPLEDVDVIAIPYNAGQLPALPGTYHPIDKTDNNGDYTMDGLANGEYFILFFRPSYAGEFYGNTQQWENATLVSLSGNTHLSNVGEALTPMANFGGMVVGAVSGVATQLTGGLPGTLVSAFDGQNQLVSTGLSGYGGVYELPQLPNGTYTLRASLVGYSTQQYGQGVPIDLNSATVVSGVDFSLSAVLGVDDRNSPKDFALGQNHPNPFNPTTTIRYAVPVAGPVKLTIYNLLGQKVRTLVDESKSSGEWEVTWNGRNEAGLTVATGVYLYQLKAAGKISVRKMMFIK